MRTIAAVLIVVLMAGCSTTDTRPFTGLTATEAKSRFGDAIFIITKDKSPTCPSELESNAKWTALINSMFPPPPSDSRTQKIAPVVLAAPLIAAGISVAASYIVSSISTALEEYKKGLAGTFGATGVQESALMNASCIIVARGHLAGKEKPENIDSFEKGKYLKWFHKALGFKDYPAFYLELQAATDEANPPSKLILKPVFLSYPTSIARNAGSGKKQVGVALAFSDSAQKKTDEIDEEKAIAIFRFHLGQLEIGKWYGKDLFGSVSASATPKSNQLTTSGYNVIAIVSDGEDPALAYQILASTFSSKKGDLEKALIDTVTNAVNAAQGKADKK